MKRAVRRHHQERMVQRAMKTSYLVWDYREGYINYTELMSRARYISNNMCSCSCSMCGNPRRSVWSEKYTLNEIRNIDSFNDQMEENENT